MVCIWRPNFIKYLPGDFTLTQTSQINTLVCYQTDYVKKCCSNDEEGRSLQFIHIRHLSQVSSGGGGDEVEGGGMRWIQGV